MKVWANANYLKRKQVVHCLMPPLNFKVGPLESAFLTAASCVRSLEWETWLFLVD